MERLEAYTGIKRRPRKELLTDLAGAGPEDRLEHP